MLAFDSLYHQNAEAHQILFCGDVRLSVNFRKRCTLEGLVL
jgi:hypothetical protein